jgi:hypothetical protein
MALHFNKSVAIAAAVFGSQNALSHYAVRWRSRPSTGAYNGALGLFSLGRITVRMLLATGARLAVQSQSASPFHLASRQSQRLTIGSNRSLRSLGRAKARPLTKR